MVTLGPLWSQISAVYPPKLEAENQQLKWDQQTPAWETQVAKLGTLGTEFICLEVNSRAVRCGEPDLENARRNEDCQV
jgi:hypothetical protein